MQTTINVVDGSLFAILVGSIAFVISLAWNDAFHNLFMHQQMLKRLLLFRVRKSWPKLPRKMQQNMLKLCRFVLQPS